MDAARGCGGRRARLVDGGRRDGRTRAGCQQARVVRRCARSPSLPRMAYCARSSWPGPRSLRLLADVCPRRRPVSGRVCSREVRHCALVQEHPQGPLRHRGCLAADKWCISAPVRRPRGDRVRSADVFAIRARVDRLPVAQGGRSTAMRAQRSVSAQSSALAPAASLPPNSSSRRPALSWMSVAAARPPGATPSTAIGVGCRVSPSIR